MPDRPVDSTTILVIKEIQKASIDFGFPVLLVGATARIILLENVFGLNAGRATSDVDFAFALDTWEQFSELKNYLVENSNCKEDGKVAQRLYMKIGGLETAYKVDLIPFGKIEIKSNTIAWPPDKTFVMNVAGYKDALAASIRVEVSDGVIINVASLPGIAILKIFAWADRGREDPKDAIDLTSLLRGYTEAGNTERIYEDAVKALEENDYDIELAGAWLLGKDAAKIAAPETVTELMTILESEKKSHLAEDMARALRVKEDALGYAFLLLEQFTKGFTGAAGKS
jgi:predicted nucleotidyltransferase